MRTILFRIGEISLIFILSLFLNFTGRAEEGLIYEIRAGNAHLARRVMGDVTEKVRDVPAVPVDSFTWNGEGYQSIEGKAYARLDPVNNTGEIKVIWKDKHGNWELEQTVFLKSPMPLGVRFGPSIDSKEKIQDAIITNAYMHGDTGTVDPMLPVLFAYIGTWGTARVTLNGKPFENPFDGPVPDWLVHSMLVTGVYDQKGRVTVQGGEIYDPSKSSRGVTDFSDLEYQLIFLDAPGDENTSIPPIFKFAYHLIFEDVELKIQQKDNQD